MEISRKDRERLAREDDILNAAEELFSSRGLEAASMEEVAKKAQFTRKTVYQHFGNKEELLAAVILRGFKLLHASFGAEEAVPGNGFEKLRAMGQAYYRFYREHPGFFGLVNHAARMKALAGKEKKKEFDKLDEAMFRFLARAIEEGKTDGSIRGDIDTLKTTASVVFTVTGFFCEFALSGKTYTEHLSMDGDGFIQFTLDLLLDSIRKREFIQP